MDIVLESVVSVILACVFAVFGSWYKDYFLEKKKRSLKETFRTSPKFLIILIVVFLIFAAVSIIIARNKGQSYLILWENQVVWYLFLLTAYIDFKVKKIPNQLILLLIVIRFCFIVIGAIISFETLWTILLFSAVGFITGGGIILICSLISRGGVGFGDMKLFAVTGLYFGLQGVIAIMMYSLFLAALYGIFLWISKKANAKSTIAMAPFIFLGLSFHLFIS